MSPLPNQEKSKIMNTETLQIGSLIISKTLIDIFAPMLGTIIGGLISYFSIKSIEERKIRQQKLDDLTEQKREAIKIALKWIDHIQNAITKVSLKSHPYQPNLANTNNWPDLLTDLAKYDLPRHLSILLPVDSYKKSFIIISLIEEVRVKIILERKTQDPEQLKELTREIIDSIHLMQKNLDEFLNTLESEYIKSFK